MIIIMFIIIIIMNIIIIISRITVNRFWLLMPQHIIIIVTLDYG
jgi:hypothetical protein